MLARVMSAVLVMAAPPTRRRRPWWPPGTTIAVCVWSHRVGWTCDHARCARVSRQRIGPLGGWPRRSAAQLTANGTIMARIIGDVALERRCRRAQSCHNWHRIDWRRPVATPHAPHFRPGRPHVAERTQRTWCLHNRLVEHAEIQPLPFHPD